MFGDLKNSFAKILQTEMLVLYVVDSSMTLDKVQHFAYD